MFFWICLRNYTFKDYKNQNAFNKKYRSDPKRTITVSQYIIHWRKQARHTKNKNKKQKTTKVSQGTLIVRFVNKIKLSNKFNTKFIHNVYNVPIWTYYILYSQTHRQHGIKDETKKKQKTKNHKSLARDFDCEICE